MATDHNDSLTEPSASSFDDTSPSELSQQASAAVPALTVSISPSNLQSAALPVFPRPRPTVEAILVSPRCLSCGDRRQQVLLMHCENRRKTYHLQGCNPLQGVYGRQAGSGITYFIIHHNCIHKSPIVHPNDKYPGVPSIFTSLYYPQFNGVYRNAIGELLEGRMVVPLRNVLELREVIDPKCPDEACVQNAYIWSQMGQFAGAWVTPRWGITPQSRSVI